MGGRVGGWLDQMEIRLNSASVEVEVEVEAELGKNKLFLSTISPTPKCLYCTILLNNLKCSEP